MAESTNPAAVILEALGHAEFERSALRLLFDANVQRGDPAVCLVSGAALVLCIGIANDHYRGFEAAAAAVRSHGAAAVEDPALRLVADAGVLVVGAFDALSNPNLLPLAERLVRAMAEPRIHATLRLGVALGVLSYFDALVDIEKVWWLELAVRDVLAEPNPPHRLAAEWHRALVVACYSCGQTARGEALRREQEARGRPALAAVELKLALLDAYTALGEGRIEAGRQALGRAEPLLRATAPQPAGEWHFLASRLAMLEHRLGDALNHARLSLRLTQESEYPERWMGLTIMQEGQVQMARGSFFEAVPFFERAHRAGTGVQADYCTCLADFARALGHADAGEPAAARSALATGFVFARQREWTGFFRATPRVAARLCAWALEEGIEPEFARAVVADRRLEAEGIEAVAWPWPIRVRTLGRFEIQIGGKALFLRGKVARKPLELLQFIIASGGSDVASGNAMFTLWPDLDGDKAKSAFNVTAHRLRKLLGRDEAVTLELGRLGLDTRVMWVDSLAFERLADQATPPWTSATVSLARRAQELYAGHFLHAEEDRSWMMVHRSRLASKFKRLVRTLSEYALASGDPATARNILERAIELDPLADDLSLVLMQILAAQGEHAAALAVHERCSAALERLLGVQPSPASVKLVASLRAQLAGGTPPKPLLISNEFVRPPSVA